MYSMLVAIFFIFSSMICRSLMVTLVGKISFFQASSAAILASILTKKVIKTILLVIIVMIKPILFFHRGLSSVYFAIIFLYLYEIKRCFLSSAPPQIVLKYWLRSNLINSKYRASDFSPVPNWSSPVPFRTCSRPPR